MRQTNSTILHRRTLYEVVKNNILGYTSYTPIKTIRDAEWDKNINNNPIVATALDQNLDLEFFQKKEHYDIYKGFIDGQLVIIDCHTIQIYDK